MKPNILRQPTVAATARRLQRERQLWNAERETVPCCEFDCEIEQWPAELETKGETLTPQERRAASALLAALDVIEPYLHAPLPATVSGIIEAVEASALTAEEKARAAEAFMLCDGYHLISANLAGPHGYTSVSDMRADIQRKLNSRVR